ncbi:cytochrome c-type biogenesis protein [Thalassotalea castellviae]|uniref:Cytochrome c-type biogenesis protein n=1 Tax=Thalassotalea castellviae TaxID=3075612 RepID=A0ABU2ZYW7_9GAMM|nr:cytochrome c-type biogenesis protein [Thalassotalea sp. W431]MDT0603113.1 cytochrome c-type biogenesis protein [Thalassotalea sp. W431]
MKYLIFILLFTVAFTTTAWETDTYVFHDEVTEIRYKSLVKELRCPKCQNQNLADSNSPIAADLRREVYQLLEQGKSDGEIVDFMVNRYGEFVLYRPKVSSLTYILWFGPAFLLLIGVIVVVQILRKKPIKKETVTLSKEQKNKLAQILKDK